VSASGVSFLSVVNHHNDTWWTGKPGWRPREACHSGSGPTVRRRRGPRTPGPSFRGGRARGAAASRGESRSRMEISRHILERGHRRRAVVREPAALRLDEVIGVRVGPVPPLLEHRAFVPHPRADRDGRQEMLQIVLCRRSWRSQRPLGRKPGPTVVVMMRDGDSSLRRQSCRGDRAPGCWDHGTRRYLTWSGTLPRRRSDFAACADLEADRATAGLASRGCGSRAGAQR
jgi:hypothetical protein